MNQDFQEFKLLLSDPIAREQVFGPAGIAIDDAKANHLLANEAQCLAFYYEVTGMLQAKVNSLQAVRATQMQQEIQGKTIGYFVVLLLAVGLVAFWVWRALFG